MFYLITEKLASAHNYFVEGQQLTHLSYITTDGQTYVLRSDISGKIFRSLIEYKDISLKLSHWNVKSPLLNDFKSHLLSSIANQLKAIHIYIYTLTAYQKTGISINSDMEKVHEYAVTSCTQLVDSITIFMAYIDYMDPDNHMLKHYVTNLYNSFQKAGPNMWSYSIISIKGMFYDFTNRTTRMEYYSR